MSKQLDPKPVREVTGYTPTTEEIRTEWALSNPKGSPTTIMHAEAAFDRWLTEHDRQVAERAWDECATKAQDLGRLDETAIPWLRGQSPYRTEEESNG